MVTIPIRANHAFFMTLMFAFLKYYLVRAVNRQPCLPRGMTRRALPHCDIHIRSDIHKIAAENLDNDHQHATKNLENIEIFNIF